MDGKHTEGDAKRDDGVSVGGGGGKRNASEQPADPPGPSDGERKKGQTLKAPEHRDQKRRGRTRVTRPKGGGGAPSAAGIEPLRAGGGARLAANDRLKAETQSMNEQKSPCMALEGCGVASN